MVRREFKALFCERFHCPPEEYERRAFKRCLYAHARLLAPVARVLSRDYFAEDLMFVGYLGATTGLREANTEVLTFQDANRAKPNLWRTGLRIRVSGRKAASLAQQLFSAAHRSGASP